jgi:hypothetical protein
MDDKINSIDFLKRWLMIYQEFRSWNIPVLGYFKDEDPKYLQAIRLASEFLLKHRQ